MIFKFYLVDNDEIVIMGYDNISIKVLNILDNSVNVCNCKRKHNVITGDPSDLIDLLVDLSKDYDILL